MIPYFLVVSIAAFLTTMLGGLMALRYRRFSAILSAFTGGVLIAVAVVDILPETIDMAILISLPLVILFLFTGSGFALLLLFERGHHLQTQPGSGNRRRTVGLAAGSEMVAHSFLEGLAIGVAFEINIGVGLAIALAVILHDISDGMSIVTIMGASGFSTRASLSMLVLESSATGLGIAFSLFFLVPANIVAVVLAFIAGGLFYIGALEMIPHAVRNSTRIAVPAVVGISGFAFICFIIAAM